MRLSRGACLKGALLGIVTFGLLYKGALLTEAGVRDNTADAAKGERDEDGNGSDFVGTPDDMRELYRLARDDALTMLSRGADFCDNWRKSPDQRCTDASQCGKGWLFRRKQLLLAIPGLNSSDAHTGSWAGDWHAGEARTVNVIGLREGGDGQEADCNAEDLSMMLRLQGPEALAKAAVPVAGRCAWSVEFHPMLEGVYTFDATLIDWKGLLEADTSKCNEVSGTYGNGSVKLDAVPSTGGPFYGGFEGCCTLCTRNEDCVAWSATNKPPLALVDGDRCVLYSSVVGEAVEDKSLEGTLRSGSPRGEEAMMFIGPSMSIGRSWCSQDNGNVMGSGERVSISAARDDGPTLDIVGGNDLPLCRSDMRHDGRWVSVANVPCDTESDKIVFEDDGWPLYNPDVFGATMAEECFLRPKNGSDNGFADGGYEWKPYSCRYDVMDAKTRTACMREKNVTRFLDVGDSLISTSRPPRTALWLPGQQLLWSTGKGRPQMGPGAELAGCTKAVYYGEDQQPHITTRYCGAEAFWQAAPGQVRDLVASFSPDVVLADWALVHRLWHFSLEQFKDFLSDLGKQLDAMVESDGHRPRYMFWLSAPFLVSEREPHCVLERAIEYNEAFRELLEPRGWIEVDWFAMTQKWGFDIADGMHHGPPPTRMLAYMLMHHICHGTE